MVNIEPVQIWKDGVVKTATKLSVSSGHDNLSSMAVFYYQLQADDVVIEEDPLQTIQGEVIATGNITMEGQDYADWAAGPGTLANTEAYNWVAGKLNVTIVS